MRLLLCCEFYYPSVGGVQEVMRQIAERLVKRGHDVTIATTKLPNRDFKIYNGVHIEEFSVKGNLVRSIEGEIQVYQDFVKNFECDAILIKAAQQWTFDALWPILSEIKARKVFIPCGFSGFYEPAYSGYFENLPKILHQFDHLIFYANDYRDTNFAREIGYKNLSIVPNGASEIEFGSRHKTDFRARYGIPKDSFLILTVGTLTGAKGHRELAETLVKLETKSKHVTLILNGNKPISIVLDSKAKQNPERLTEELANAMTHSKQAAGRWAKSTLDSCIDLPWRAKQAIERWARGIFFSYIDLPRRALRVLFAEGWNAALGRVSLAFHRIFLSSKLSVGVGPMTLQNVLDKMNKDPRKQGYLMDLSRAELIEAYQEADLFVFASIIEYSPLVLFEAAASATPFLTVPVGNAVEIAEWTEGGVICPAPKDKFGYMRVDPQELANHIQDLMQSPDILEALGERGRANWEKYFSWEKITDQYEAILEGKHIEEPAFLKDHS